MKGGRSVMAGGKSLTCAWGNIHVLFRALTAAKPSRTCVARHRRQPHPRRACFCEVDHQVGSHGVTRVAPGRDTAAAAGSRLDCQASVSCTSLSLLCSGRHAALLHRNGFRACAAFWPWLHDGVNPGCVCWPSRIHSPEGLSNVSQCGCDHCGSLDWAAPLQGTLPVNPEWSSRLKKPKT